MKNAITTLITIGFLSFCGCENHQSAETNEILDNLSPNMYGLAENIQENDAGIAYVNNTADRLYIDDWRRVMLLDRPTTLSPFPVIGN